MTLDWQNGLPYSPRFGDVYFSCDSGLEETSHVFLEGNRLPERFAALRRGGGFAIGETGFGTGLNFLCACRLFEQTAPQDACLDFFSIEKFPLSDDDLRAALALWPELGAQAEALCSRWRRRVPGWNRWSFAGGRVRLTLAWSDVADALPEMQGGIDAWFLDGFSPAKNPEMWAQPVLDGIARASRAGATVASYTSAGWVRRGLQQARFEIERVAGFGRKREMLRGTLAAAPATNTQGQVPSSAMVIGGGLAGCAAARALAQRGVAVTLIERADALARAASGNPRGILHARFGAGMNALHRFVLAAYGHTLALLDEVLPVDGTRRAECGLLQLGAPETEATRIRKLAALEWPEHLLEIVDAAEASRLAGMTMAHGGLWFPSGGWVVPPQLCEQLADHPQISRQFGHEVLALERTPAGWRASGADWQLETDTMVVCCAHEARKLEPFSAFPLQAVRGQVSELAATKASEQLRSVVCAEGYCAPAADGRHVAGATTVFDDEGVELREAEHADNLAKLAAHMPALFAALGAPQAAGLAGRAAVRCSVPGAMPLVGEVAPGLYCSLAHGTRGLLTAGIAGEVVAASMCHGIAPLPRSILAALSPERLTRQKTRSGRGSGFSTGD